MKTKIVKRIFLGTALVVAALGGYAYGAGERHPEIHRAMNKLHAAKNDLEHAAHDFGGHRTNAVGHIDQAISELEQALQFDKK